MSRYTALRKAAFIHPAALRYGEALVKAVGASLINPRTRSAAHLAPPGTPFHTFMNIARTARQQVRGVLQDTRIHIAVPASRLGMLLGSGEVKNTFQLGGGGGLRGMMEMQQFGIHPAAPAAQHPVYGFLARPKDITEGEFSARSPATDFGRVVLRLKPQVHSRATVSFGDSFSSPAPKPTSLLKPTFHAVPEGEVGAYKDISGFHQHSRSSYVEAQVHGGVKLSDVEHIHFEDPELRAGPPAEAVMKQLWEKHGITSSVGIGKGRFQTYGGDKP